MLIESKVLDRFLDDLKTQILGDALDLSVVLEMLEAGHLIKDKILLRAVANELSGLLKLLSDIEASDLEGAPGGLNLSGQALEGCALTSTIDTQQSKALSSLQAE